MAAGIAWLLAPEAPPTKGGVSAPGLAELVVVLAGALLVLGTARTVASGWRARAWPSASGVVKEVRSLGGLYLYTLCRYTVGEAPHELAAVRYGLARFSRFREGDTVTVRYDPDDPARGAVHPAVSPLAVTALSLGLLVLTLGAFSLA